MKTEVTDIVQRYRLALRYIWNSCFWDDPNLRNWDSVYSFRSLKLPLFRALIADYLGLDESDKIFGPSFEVVPNMENGAGLTSLQVNTRLPTSPDGGIWETVNGPLKAGDVRLTLVDLFDWTSLGYIDLRYYVVLVDGFRNHTDKVGHHALVDVNEVGVFFWTGEDNRRCP